MTYIRALHLRDICSKSITDHQRARKVKGRRTDGNERAVGREGRGHLSCETEAMIVTTTDNT